MVKDDKVFVKGYTSTGVWVNNEEAVVSHTTEEHVFFRLEGELFTRVVAKINCSPIKDKDVVQS